QHEHPKPQPYPCGHRGQMADGHYHFQPWLLAVLIVWQGNVVADPQRLEPRLFSVLGSADQRVRGRAGAAQQAVQAELKSVCHLRFLTGSVAVRPDSTLSGCEVCDY